MTPSDMPPVGSSLQPDATVASPYRWQDWVLAGIVALLLFLHASLYAWQTPVGVPPDELAHLTYVQEVAQDGARMPDYAGSRVLPWRLAPNYLQHPPLYYWVMGAVGKATGWDPLGEVAGFRLLSAAMVALGLLLWAMTARAMGLSWKWTLPLGLSVNAVPMFAYLAGSVNNDALCYLAVALAVFGLANLPRWPRLAWYLGGIGLAVAMLTKATGALFLLALFVFWLAQETRLDPRAPVLRNRHFQQALALAMVPVVAYFAWAMLRFGSVFPHAGEAHPRVTLAAGEALGNARLAWEFVTQFCKLFTMVPSHASTIPLDPAWSKALLLVFGLPVFALCWSQLRRRRDARDARDWIVTAFLLALLATLAVHFVMVVRAYHQYGAITGMHPRYYAYLLPGLAIMAGVRRSRFTRALLMLFCVAACALLLVVPYRTWQTEHAHHFPEGSIAFPTRALPGAAPAPVFAARPGAGHVDSLVLVNDTLRGSGWAVDSASGKAAGRVRLYYGGVEIGSVEVDGLRPDVARVLGKPAAARSGFSLQVTGVPFGVRPCDLGIAAEQADGGLVRLRAPNCP